MTIIEETTAYERWLADHCPVVADGLREKHEKMAKSPFRFFRATCYRFARVLPGIARDRPGAPIVPSVGDAHVENFGTWRDDEGRLVWGINDFDEAAALPWSYDLMRLATSARLAPAGKGRGAKGSRRSSRATARVSTGRARVSSMAALHGWRRC